MVKGIGCPVIRDIKVDGSPQMPKVLRTAGTAFLSILTLGSVAPAGEQPPGQTRVTIRGSGNNVTLERAPALAPSVAKGAGRTQTDVLAEAVRLKTDGFDDATVIDYLRAHRVDLPAVIELESVRRLRTAGAGDPVVSYLSTLAALDIGATGEGGAPVVVSSMPGGEGAYGAPYGYSMDGGGYYYGGGYVGAPYAGRFGHRGVFPARRFPVGHPLPHPGFPKVFPIHRPGAHPMPSPHSGRPGM
jgi:hypothetical protein